MVPAHWDVQGYQDYDGFAWYKKTFSLSKDFSNENMILLLGKIDDIDQTFVNGILVGSTGKWNFTGVPTDFDSNEEYRINRVYSVPQKILKYGETNTIVVRVYDGFKNGGIYDGPIGLITQENYKKHFGKNKN
jgi:sialate O-acetylesterase